jgi:hypothetical protein
VEKFFGFDRKAGGGDTISSEIIPGYNPKDFEDKPLSAYSTSPFKFRTREADDIPGYNPKDFEDVVVPKSTTNPGFQFGGFQQQEEGEVIEGYNPKDFEDPPKRESSWVLL